VGRRPASWRNEIFPLVIARPLLWPPFKLSNCASFCYPNEVRSELLGKVTRVVVKVGTGVLTDSRKQPDLAQMEHLASQIAAAKKAGREIVLVSSGAVGAGMGVLGHTKRPTDLAELQACAAIGQSRLMATYDKLFSAYDVAVAQVLLTHADLEHHERHLNARNTLINLLRHGVVPIVNENDAVSFTELKFGDNDRLSALVSCLLPSDLLVILTTVEGVIENFGKPGARVISRLDRIDESLEKMAGGTDSPTAVGGMISKIQAAKMVVRSGIPLIIASGKKQQGLTRVLDGREEGTLFLPEQRGLRGRKRWIAFFHHPKGVLYVDDGAKKALRENGRSLLPPGIARCEGTFDAGDVIRICDLNGTEFARGLAGYSARDITAGALKRVEVVHRDNLVVL
jgi:glutamate 5-kinase